MPKVLLTVRLDPRHATAGAVRRRLHLADADLDEDFGVVPVDPDAGIYAIMVEESAAAAAERPDVKGPFSDPVIETFGPPPAD